MCCRVSVRTKARIPVGRSVQLSRGCRKSQGGAGPRVSATAPRAVSLAPVLGRATAPVAALAAVAIRLAAQAPAYRYGWGDAATTAAGVRDNRLSFPSGHAALAFAAATSYLVLARRQHLRHGTRNAVLLYVGAASVGALRLEAGRHFPTDVLGGAALGSAVGWLVARFHP